MTDINYSYSLGNTEPAATAARSGPPDDPTLWSFSGVELIRLDNDLTLLVDRVSGKRLMVQPEVGITLTHCEAFRTLRGHAEHLVTVLPELGGQVDPIIPVLAQIRDLGLMRSAETVLQNLTEETDARRDAPLRVFIITCDRPEAVERLIASLEAQSGLDLPESYWLIDDSRDPDNIRRNQSLVGDCAARGQVPLRYFGLDERAALMTHLTTTHPEHADAVAFLLDRKEWGTLPTYGISRSLALLLSAGARAVVLDDDILCEAVRSPLPASGIHFGSVKSREAVFYSSRDELLAKTQRLPDNPISLAARQLGAPLARGIKSLLHGDLSPMALANANGAFMRTLKPGSRILQTQCSTWGDPGTGSGHWIAGLNPESVGRLLDCPEGLSATVDARSSWLGYTGPTLSKHGIMSQLTGYDATQLLPPFMPALRGEDSLFAYMLTTLHPDSLVLNHDWAITHLPLEERGQRSLRGRIANSGGLGLLTRWLGEHVDLSEGIAPATRLARIAQSITELTELDHRDLLNFGRVELAKSQAAQLEAYKNQLAMAPQLQSSNWTQYLERGTREIFEALQQEPNTTDLLGVVVDDESHAFATLRQGGKRFAQALRAWPDLWSAAQDFKL